MKILLIALLAVFFLANGKMITKISRNDNITITTYIDESSNYTKRVIQDGQTAPTTYATQSVLLYSNGAFYGSTYLKAVRTDQMITITILPLTGSVSTAQSLFLYTASNSPTTILNEEFYPRYVSTSPYTAAWPVFVTDGGSCGDCIGRVHWYGYKGWNSGGTGSYYYTAYFQFYGVNSGNFATGSPRGWNKAISFSYRQY